MIKYNLIQIVNNILSKYFFEEPTVELHQDFMRNPQVVYCIGDFTFYLTHNINEGKWYFSKYGISDTMIIDRIINTVSYVGSKEDEMFVELCEQIKEDLTNIWRQIKNCQM